MKTTSQKVTQRSMAIQAGIGPDFLNHIIRGRRPCPPAVALRLEKVTGISKETWVWGTIEEIQQAVRQCKERSRQLVPRQGGSDEP